ncbi:hypothetical protein EON66_07045, partial [archaeon]
MDAAVHPYLAVQISDAGQHMLNVNYPTANQPDTVGFVPKAVTSVHKLRAFLNNGFLISSDVGVDVRVVSVDTANGLTAKFQYKFSTQRVFNAEQTLYTTNGGMFTTKATALHALNNGESTGLYLYFDVTTADLQANKLVVDDRYYLNITHNEGIAVLTRDANTVHLMAECAG